MRNLKQGNQEFSMDANGYLHYLDTRLYESHSKLGNAANSEEAIALAEEWIGGIRTAWPSAKSSFLNLKTFPEPFPSQYLGKPTAAAIASSDAKSILYWEITYPIELRPTQWEEAVPLIGASITFKIKGSGHSAILGGMEYNFRPVNRTIQDSDRITMPSSSDGGIKKTSIEFVYYHTEQKNKYIPFYTFMIENVEQFKTETSNGANV